MRICIITITRADFGLLKNLIFKIKENKNFSLKVIASGSHFSKKHGYTYKEIRNNKIKIDKKIICKFSSDNPESLSKVMSECILKSSSIFKTLKPDMLIVLGDRYEILASTISAHLFRIPVAHIHGGELTEASMTSGYILPSPNHDTLNFFSIFWLSSIKTSINNLPIIFLFCSGSYTFFNASRNKLLAST